MFLTRGLGTDASAFSLLRPSFSTDFSSSNSTLCLCCCCFKILWTVNTQINRNFKKTRKENKNLKKSCRSWWPRIHMWMGTPSVGLGETSPWLNTAGPRLVSGGGFYLVLGWRRCVWGRGICQLCLHLALGCAFIMSLNFDPWILFRIFFFKPSSHFSRVCVVKTR